MMSDPYGLDQYLRSLDDQEAAGEEACYKAAVKNGLTVEQAENCDDCEYKCPECPWKEENQ
jgi:hypothetical protein